MNNSAAQSIIDDQAQFRVRFTRARGFAGLFERPENSYQWSGYGTLSVEPRGIQFRATRRRVIGLPRAEARFVAGREISNVYREGDGVRVEFRDDEQQNVLNFWAEDSAAAANIVDQLPTAHTVEVDEPTRRAARPGKRAFRLDLLVVAAGALAVIAASAWGTVHWLNRAPVATTTSVSGTSSPKPLDLAIAVKAPEALDATSPVESPTPVDAAELKLMQRDFERFDERSTALRAQFYSAFAALQDGSLSQTDFADGVERWLLPQWASAAKGLRDKSYAPGSPREELRNTLLAVTNDWRDGLEGYVSGLRAQESDEVLRALADIGSAEDSERKAQRLATR